MDNYFRTRTVLAFFDTKVDRWFNHSLSVKVIRRDASTIISTAFMLKVLNITNGDDLIIFPILSKKPVVARDSIIEEDIIEVCFDHYIEFKDISPENVKDLIDAGARSFYGV